VGPGKITQNFGEDGQFPTCILTSYHPTHDIRAHLLGQTKHICGKKIQ
jgi:hypothetical protein